VADETIPGEGKGSLLIASISLKMKSFSRPVMIYMQMKKTKRSWQGKDGSNLTIKC
jgi:hypothetical protein